MRPSANTLGGEIDLTWVGFGIGNEFGNRLGRKRRIGDDNEWRDTDARNGHEVFGEIEIKLGVERSVDGVGRYGHQQRVPV